MLQKNTNRITRARRTRAKVQGTSLRPRLSIFRSNKHLYAQIIDDAKSVTLVQAQDSEVDKKLTPTEKAKAIGKLIAEKAKSKNISAVTFDRGGYKYHGIVKALAESARSGLKF